MNFEYSKRSRLCGREFPPSWTSTSIPTRRRYHEQIPRATAGSLPRIIEELKPKARAAGLWNLFLPRERARRRAHQPRVRPAVRDHGPFAHGARGLQLLRARYRQHGSARALRHARSSKERWLKPLLAGEIRSCFAMTEPEVASSDATNIQSQHRARRRRVRHQRPQVVDVRRRRSALQDRHLHGQDRPGRAASTSSSR